EGERRTANRDMAHLLNLAADLATSEGSPTGSWALVLELLAQSHELRFRDPAGMVRFAEMAQVVAARLRPEEYGERPIADLRARVYAGLANAQRVAENLEAAQRATTLAEEARQEGTGDLMIKAHLLNLDAALRRDQERSGEALSLLRRAHGIYAELGERHLAGRVLVSQALCHGYREELSEALRLLTLGSAQIDPDRDPPLAALAEQNICWVLTHLGRFLEVKERLARSDLRRVLAGEPLNLLRLDWLEGRIALGMGDSARAESLLQKVHGALLEAGKARDARRVASDLAALHSGEWRTTGLRI
ncbi:MAG TPA: hypothetical protein VMM92_11645, partial [Thermoanaerobaculia bacterium]|nr:hypothetical protein [Thermoanaerobaculia bacterium]